MRFKVPEWLYLDPTKPKHEANEKDSWGAPKQPKSCEEPATEEDCENANVRRPFSVVNLRLAGGTAIGGIRETYQRLDAMPGRTMSGALNRVVMLEELNLAAKEEK